MTDPHNRLPTPEQPEQRPDFMQVFDGTQAVVSREEQAQVAEEFDSFVEEMWRTREGAREGTFLGGRGRRNVTLSKPAPQEPHARWAATFSYVPAENVTDLLKPQTTITIVYFDGQDREREQFVYEKGSDGVVRREDWPDIFLENQALGQVGLLDPTLNPTPGEPATLEQLIGYLDRREEDAPNEQLAEEMGMNNQPISKAEFDGLKAMWTADDVTPPRRP